MKSGSTRRRTVRQKLSALFLILFLAGSILLLGQWIYLGGLLDDTAAQQLYAGVATQLAEQLEPLMHSGAPESELSRALMPVHDYAPNLAIYLLNDHGHVIAELSPHTRASHNDVPLDPIRRFSRAVLDELPIYNRNPASSGSAVFSAAPINFRGQPGWLYVVINGSDLYDQSRGITRENTHLLWGATVGLLSLAAVVAIALSILSRLSKKFDRIISAVRTYREGAVLEFIPVDSNDELGELSYAINDMSRRITENFEILEQRDTVRRELIANVSHDIRGPVARMKLALEQLDSRSIGDAEAPLRAVRTSCTVLEHMLSELFELAKLEAKETVPKVTEIPVDELLKDICLMFHEQAQAKNLQIHCVCEDGLPDAYGDPVLLSRAIGNLVENAIRYTPASGCISLGVGLEGAPQTRNTPLRVFIQDTGVGIAESEIPQLFSRYYRGDKSRPETPGSTGLGLSIVKRILELHGTAVDVQSAPGSGTRFSFLLPTTPPHKA